MKWCDRVVFDLLFGERDGAICTDDNCRFPKLFGRRRFFIFAVIDESFVASSAVDLDPPLVKEHRWHNDQGLGYEIAEKCANHHYSLT